jgi:hypothetical protein
VEAGEVESEAGLEGEEGAAAGLGDLRVELDTLRLCLVGLAGGAEGDGASSSSPPPPPPPAAEAEAAAASACAASAASDTPRGIRMVLVASLGSRLGGSPLPLPPLLPLGAEFVLVLLPLLALALALLPLALLLLAVVEAALPFLAMIVPCLLALDEV